METFCARIGIARVDDEPPGGAAPPVEERAPVVAPPSDPEPRTFRISMPRCFGCLLVLLCGRRLAPA